MHIILWITFITELYCICDVTIFWLLISVLIMFTLSIHQRFICIEYLILWIESHFEQHSNLNTRKILIEFHWMLHLKCVLLQSLFIPTDLSSNTNDWQIDFQLIVCRIALSNLIYWIPISMSSIGKCNKLNFTQ